MIGFDIEAQLSTGSNQMSIENIIFTTDIDRTGTTVSSGNIAWDDNYFYVKTSAGWKRTGLSTF